jgi:hypothetical protein
VITRFKVEGQGKLETAIGIEKVKSCKDGKILRILTNTLFLILLRLEHTIIK